MSLRAAGLHPPADLARRDRRASSPTKFAIQLNDTHPTLAVAELMRLLMDVHDLGWDEAWDDHAPRVRVHEPHAAARGARDAGRCRCSQRLLPRHLEIIYEINRRFLDEVRARFPGDDARVRRDVADRRGRRASRCAWRTSRRSRATTINGVAALHSRLLRETVLRDFAELWPERFTNVTNGVTPRRFVALANPRLAELITEAIGDGWLRDLDALRELERFADDAGVPGPLARGQAREQARARRRHVRRGTASSIRTRCSTCSASASTSTSAST